MSIKGVLVSQVKSSQMGFDRFPEVIGCITIAQAKKILGTKKKKSFDLDGTTMCFSKEARFCASAPGMSDENTFEEMATDLAVWLKQIRNYTKRVGKKAEISEVVTDGTCIDYIVVPKTGYIMVVHPYADEEWTADKCKEALDSVIALAKET